jgi:hypothetical protein
LTGVTKSGIAGSLRILRVFLILCDQGTSQPPKEERTRGTIFVSEVQYHEGYSFEIKKWSKGRITGSEEEDLSRETIALGD